MSPASQPTQPIQPTQPPRAQASSQLLLDLVNNHLDPGYAEASLRRGPNAKPQRYATVAVALGCAVIGFLLVVSYVHTNRGAPEAVKVHDRLVNRVRDAQNTANTLTQRASSLEAQVNAERESALPQSGTLARQLQLDTVAAGEVAVSGPGLSVTLSDPEAPSPAATAARGGSVPITSTNTLTDRDVRSVVNELWHDGAEAIAVNGVRLTPTSTVRFAGQVVLVDFVPITSPYRIEAIGDRDGLAVAFAQSTVASRYQTLRGVQGIGFSFADSGKLSLPAGSPSSLRYAAQSRPHR